MVVTTMRLPAGLASRRIDPALGARVRADQIATLFTQWRRTTASIRSSSRAVSTSTTRGQSLSAIRQKNTGKAREAAQAEHEYDREHRHDVD